MKLTREESAAMEAVLAEHEGLVQSIARKFVRPGVCVEDLLQEVRLAVLRAVESYKPGIGTLSGYVGRCVCYAVMDHMRDIHSTIRVPRHHFSRVWRDCVPLDTPCADGSLTLAEVLAQPEGDALDSDETALVRRAVALLPTNHRAVVEGLYLQGRSLRDLAADAGCTFQNIQFISKKALRSLSFDPVLAEIYERRAA